MDGKRKKRTRKETETFKDDINFPEREQTVSPDAEASDGSNSQENKRASDEDVAVSLLLMHGRCSSNSRSSD